MLPVRNHHLSRWLTTLRGPVAPWHGEADRLVPLGHAMALAAVIPQCTTCVEPGGGHFFYSRRLTEIIGSLLPPPGLTDSQQPDLARVA